MILIELITRCFGMHAFMHSCFHSFFINTKQVVYNGFLFQFPCIILLFSLPSSLHLHIWHFLVRTQTKSEKSSDQYFIPSSANLEKGIMFQWKMWECHFQNVWLEILFSHGIQQKLLSLVNKAIQIDRLLHPIIFYLRLV